MTDVFASVRGKSQPTYSEIREVVDRVLEAAPRDSQLRHAADMAARELDEPMLRKLAADRLLGLARNERRVQVLRVENEAVQEKTAVAQETPKSSARRPQRGTTAHRRWLAEDPDNQKYEDELEEARMQAFVDLGAELQKAMTQYTAAIRMEWTRELLGSEFALPNGERVTWGDATVEQHEQRLHMFMDKAAANLEGAARHRKALEELEKMGARNLNALIGARAA